MPNVHLFLLFSFHVSRLSAPDACLLHFKESGHQANRSLPSSTSFSEQVEVNWAKSQSPHPDNCTQEGISKCYAQIGPSTSETDKSSDTPHPRKGQKPIFHFSLSNQRRKKKTPVSQNVPVIHRLLLYSAVDFTRLISFQMHGMEGTGIIRPPGETDDAHGHDVQ